MQFLNPAAFYLLGAIPIVVALHFLKLRRHRHLVPSIMLWRSTDEDRRANVPFQRLRNLLLPILQVLFLLLVIFSVARPALRRPGFIPGRAILIVDNSASMLSTETGKTRLNLAKQAARRHIEEVSTGGGMMLMVTSATESDAYIREAFTTDTAKLRIAIENIPQSHTARNLRHVFDAASRYVASTQDKVFLISHNFENLPDTSLSVHKIGVGGDAENIGIVRFSAEIVGDRYEVLVGVQNFTDTVREVEVELAVENATFDSKTVSIPSKETKPVLFSDDPAGLVGEVIRVHLPVEDDFMLDNSAAAVLSDVSPLRILLVSDNQNSLLPPLLETSGEHVDLHQVVPADYIGTGDTDIAIFDGGTPAGREALARASDAAPGTHLIFINPGNNLPFIGEADGLVEEVTAPVRVIETAEAHPLLTNVSLQGVWVLKSMSRTLPLLGRSLVETEGGTLIWLAQASGRQFLVFEFDAFNPEVSNFAMTIPDAPLFVYQSLARFASGTAMFRPLEFEDGRTRHAFHTGEPVRITSIAEGASIHIEKPDKKRVKVEDSVFIETDQVGVYTLYADDSAIEKFTVNLLDADTSALSYSAATTETDTSASVENGLQPMTQEVWRFPALLACILLLLEWWFYHREGVSVRSGLDGATA